MTTVNARDLARKTADVLDEVEKTGRPTLVVRNGRPVAALVAIDESEREDFVLASAPEYVRGMKQANAALAAGTIREADDLFAELDADE
jgi:prevent-host-death family protein